MNDEGASGGAEGGDKRAPRIKLSEIAAIELGGGRTIGVVVGDVSATGFRLESNEPLAVGMRVKLVMRRYDPVPAEIRWVDGHEAGAVFLASAQGTVA